ncbi:hypothetical protein Cgig2_019686 [Carnegiea gigantea]|uniref:Uncharacterized protein n=1 Tax=Carnegiea gigantea TaxID=171969 RepID=A0A9Q1QAY6_9CARY|nr:hypothetical protein Cgig2_019686 [Carnegiea gigantea]
MPRPYVGEAAATINSPGPATKDMYVRGASAAGEGECTPPAYLAANVEDCTYASTDEGDNEATDEPGIESLYHAPPTIADSVAADHEACVQPSVDESIDRVTIPEKPRSRKPTAIHGSPFTDPTHLLGARKSKKEMNEGVIGADEPRAVDDPSERSMDLPVLDVQALSVEGSGIGPSVEELSMIKLTKQVLASCIFAPLSATEMELVTKVTLHNKGRISSVIWDNFKATPQSNVRYRIALVLMFLRSTTYADAGQCEVVTPKCPEQRKYV